MNQIGIQISKPNQLPLCKKMLRCGLKRLSFLVFVFFVVAPLTLMVWRGIWGLLDEYITTINDEVNITSSTYHPSTGCNFKNKTHPSDDNLQNVHPGKFFCFLNLMKFNQSKTLTIE